MKKLYAALSGIFAVIPGLAIIISGLGVLPGKKLVFAGTIEAVCCLGILLVWMNRQQIALLTSKTINKYVLLCGLLFVTALSFYMILYDRCVHIDNNIQTKNPKALDEDYTVVFSIVSRGQSAQLLESFPDKQQAVNTIGATLLNDAIKTDGVMYSITIIIFLLLYIVLTLSLTVAFTLLAIIENAPLIPNEEQQKNITE